MTPPVLFSVNTVVPAFVLLTNKPVPPTRAVCCTLIVSALDDVAITFDEVWIALPAVIVDIPLAVYVKVVEFLIKFTRSAVAPLASENGVPIDIAGVPPVPPL